MSKLNQYQSALLEGELAISELSQALSKMKNNKTAGIDGIPAESLTFFWARIKYFILRSLNYSFKHGELSISLRQCIITYLPTENKP